MTESSYLSVYRPGGACLRGKKFRVSQIPLHSCWTRRRRSLFCYLFRTDQKTPLDVEWRFLGERWRWALRLPVSILLVHRQTSKQDHSIASPQVTADGFFVST